MKKQTAVEWLIEQINQDYPEINWAYKDKCEQAKEIEREQIINAYDAGTFYLEGGLYYKETFEDESGI
jgi:hypothetical protein